jgi:agmatinase
METIMYNFLGLPPKLTDPEKARIVVMPVPYDGTSTWVKGADFGPTALIEASHQVELFDLETKGQAHLLGVHTDEPMSEKRTTSRMVEAVYKRSSMWLDKGKFLVTLGGEHSVSLGVAKAHAERHSELTVLQFDAHADTRPRYEGSPYNHACVMARIREFAPILQVGIRSMDASEFPHLDPARVFYARDIIGRDEWLPRLLDKLTPKVYITFDLDAFDPSIMPSTGTPEPGGLLWYQTLSILKAVSERSEIVGFDVVELCPNPRNKAPDFMAAKLAYTLLNYRFARRTIKE